MQLNRYMQQQDRVYAITWRNNLHCGLLSEHRLSI